MSDEPSTQASVSLARVAQLTERVSHCEDPDELIEVALTELEAMGIAHTMLFMFDDAASQLSAIATRGYEPGVIGHEVQVGPGEGVLGTAAMRARPVRIGNLQRLLMYGSTVRRMHLEDGARAAEELVVPGLADAQSQVAVPVMLAGQVTGVLAAESAESSAFTQDHEGVLVVVAALIANALEVERVASMAPVEATVASTGEGAAIDAGDGAVPAVRVRHYLEDGSTFLDDEYLVRGVPGRLLWKLLTEATTEGRHDFTNREVRLDPALELPAHRDNFESRLILLTRRLQERHAPVRIEKTGRGRFRLVFTAPVVLDVA